MAIHNDIGKTGEQMAVEHLISEGYIIRDVNWRCKKSEIDIVAEKGTRLAIVEVKTRTSDFTDPAEAIDKKKIMNLVRAAREYINRFNLDMEVQFDVISIIITPEETHLEHIPDAFFPPLKHYR